MQIRWKYLIGINGVLLVLWVAHIAADQIWDRQDMLRIEARALQNLAAILRDVGFGRGRPLPQLPDTLSALVRIHRGSEIMVIDARSMVIASSVAGRRGRQWKEQDIDRVLSGREVRTWQVGDHYHGDLAMLDVTVPVSDPAGRITHAVHVARRLDLIEDMLRTRRYQHLAWAAGSLLLMSLVISLVTYLWLIRPVNRMSRAVAASRWGREEHGSGDELARLHAATQQMIHDATAAVEGKEQLLQQVQSFNERLEDEIRIVRDELTRTQADLVRGERLSAVGELAVGLAHELRNPLHIVRGDAELLARQPVNREACEDILEEVDRIDRFITELLDYTRPLEPGKDPEEVAPVIRSAVDAVRRTMGSSGVQIVVTCDEDLVLPVEPDHLRQVLVNLVSNAAEAVDGQGEVTVRASKQEGGLRVEVTDRGRGIAEPDREQVFSPFFTRRPAGTGLGLSIVQRLVQLYDGTIELNSEPGNGTTFTVLLPDVKTEE